jgi:hypothetical protein
MENYEFRLVGGDGSPLRREFHALDNEESLWSGILAFAHADRGATKQIQALDSEGGIVIGIGVKAAARLAARARPPSASLAKRLSPRRSRAAITPAFPR